MAEAFGVVAAGIAVGQLAGTVGGAVLKLKCLWDEVEGAHETIEDLINQIQFLSPAIWEVEQLLIQNTLPHIFWDDEAIKYSARYSRTAQQKMFDIVNDMSAQIHSAKWRQRKIGSIKVVLKKTQLRTLENRLENSVKMLSLAQNGYLM